MKKWIFCAVITIAAIDGAVIVQAVGPANTYGTLDGGDSPIALAIGFTLNQTYSNVAITAALYSATGNESLTAYVTNAIGIGTTAANNIASPIGFSLGPPSDPPADLNLFSGLTLSPGTYYFIVKAENVDPQGSAEWAGNNALPAVLGQGVSGLTYYLDFFPSTFGPAGGFSKASVTGAPIFSITGDAAGGDVPEPSTITLVAAAILGLSRKFLAAASRRVSHRPRRSS
ncbi:MAG: hypothetical protein FJW32_14525 [Acidobacteria bacterium]|nr:hypothetical protein [Acidobacteriota bacterium]